MTRLMSLCFTAALAGIPMSAQAPGPIAQEKPSTETPKKSTVHVLVAVKDEAGKPMNDVAVTIDDKEAYILCRGNTDESGIAKLIMNQEGEHFIRIRKPGHAPEQKAVVLEAEKRLEVSFVMKKAKA